MRNTEERVLGYTLSNEQMAIVAGGDIVVECSPRNDEVEEETEEK